MFVYARNLVLMQVLIETQTFAERWKCVPVPAQTKRSHDASPAEDVRYHWEREVQLLDTSRRGSSLFLRDPNYVEGVQDEKVESWMKGRVDAWYKSTCFAGAKVQILTQVFGFSAPILSRLTQLQNPASMSWPRTSGEGMRLVEEGTSRPPTTCSGWRACLSK
jgi:hypothetical protein